MAVNRTGWAHMSPEVRERTRKKHAERLKAGETHPRSKTWRLLSPTGEYFETKQLRTFCEERGLSYAAFRNRAHAKSTTPIEKGPAKGWSLVLSIYYADYKRKFRT